MTLSREEFGGILTITIVHPDVNKKKFEIIKDEIGNGTYYIGAKIGIHKFGFSVSSKKYNIDGTSHRVKGKRGTLIIEIPRKNKKIFTQEKIDVVSGEN